jgi:MFS transporter, AAHS family, 3-hydroxyphenylpropionic acid transporter
MGESLERTIESPPSAVQSGLLAVMVLCGAAAVMEGIDIQSTGLVAPQYSREFGFSTQYLGTIIFGLNNFGMFAGSILAGWATDRMGRRWTAIMSMICFGVFSVGCALAPSGLIFTILRPLIGVGIGGSLANIIAIMAEAGSLRNRAVRVTVMTAAVAVGGVIPGAIIARWPMLDWRAIYHIGGWSPIAVGLAMLLWLPESAPFLKARSAAPEHAPAGGVSIFAGLFTDGRAKLTVILWLASFGCFLIYYVANNWLPSLMVARHFGTRASSLAAVMFTGGGAIGTVLLGLLLGRARQLTIVLTFVGCIAAVCGLALIGRVGLVLPVAFALGAFATTAKNMMYGFSPLYYPVTMRGAGVGLAVASGRIGSIVGPAAAGILLGGGRGSPAVLLSLVPVLVLAMIATLALGWLRMPEPE